MIQADFAFQTDSTRTTVATIGKTSVPVPSTQWNGKGIKWFDDSQLLKQPKTYTVVATCKCD